MNKQPKDPKEAKARADLVEIAKKHDWFFVIWWGHTGDSFVIFKRTEKCKDMEPEIYGAMYEQFYDVSEGGERVELIRLPKGFDDYHDKWCFVLEKVQEFEKSYNQTGNKPQV